MFGKFSRKIPQDDLIFDIGFGLDRVYSFRLEIEVDTGIYKDSKLFTRVE